MSVFNLNDSFGYNITLCDLGCRQSKDAAALIIKHARNLTKFKYAPELGSQLASADTKLSAALDALNEALFAVKTARREYEQNTEPSLVAAE